VTACVDADGKHGVYLVTIDGKVIRKLSEGNGRVGDPGFSPDGKFVVFWANAGVLGHPGFDGGDIVVASTDGKRKPRRVTRMTDTVYDADPAFSPNGDQLAFRRPLAGTVGEPRKYAGGGPHRGRHRPSNPSSPNRIVRRSCWAPKTPFAPSTAATIAKS
jgi:Tol biopolymer transport system component